MQSIQLFSQQSLNHFPIQVLPDALNKKITLIACIILAALGAAFLAIKYGWIHAFKTESAVPKPVTPVVVQPKQEEEQQAPREVQKEEPQTKDIEPKKEETKVKGPEENKKVPGEDKEMTLCDALFKYADAWGAKKFINSLFPPALVTFIKQCQKEDETILKLSELCKEILFPADGSMMEYGVFAKLTDALKEIDLEKLIDKGGDELKLFCMAPAILKIVNSNSSPQAKETMLDEAFKQYQEIHSKVFNYTPHLKEDRDYQAFLLFGKRMDAWLTGFCEYLAKQCPTAEIETLGRAYSRYGYSFTMRQQLGLSLLIQSLMSKDLNRIKAATSVYWENRKIFAYGVVASDAYKNALIQLIESEEMLQAVYTAISNDKEEMKAILRNVNLPKDVLDKVLG